MDMEARPVIRLVQWSEEASFHLGKALNPCALADAKREVNSGIAQLWDCNDGEFGGYVVTRVDRTEQPRGVEWCWVACAGKGFHRFAPDFIAAAKRFNLPIRGHVNRPGLVRMYERFGFKYSETIMRMAV
jgi:hypothetical protein